MNRKPIQEVKGKTILLVWVTPYNIGLYVLKNVLEEDINLLKSANNKFINNDEDVDSVLKVSDYFSDNLKYCKFKDDSKNGQWANTKVNTPIESPIDLVFMCGWV